MQTKLKSLQEEKNNFSIENEEAIKNIYSYNKDIDTVLSSFLILKKKILNFLKI